MALLEGKGILKKFGGLTAVNNVEFKISKGEIVGLIGPNGSGKTTLFNCITGLMPMDKGIVKFEGKDITHHNQCKIANRGLYRTFQETRIYKEMTAFENMLISVDHRGEGLLDMLRSSTSQTRKRARELLEFLDLNNLKDESAGNLSFGQQKLLEFAMVLMPSPKIMLLDEPAGGINPTLINKLMDHIREVNQEYDLSFFIIEHNMEVIMSIAQRIYVLNQGELIAQGEPMAIQKNQEVIDAYLGT